MSDERVEVQLTVTTNELAALFAATFSQEKRINEIMQLANDGMLLDVFTELSDDLAMVRSARRKIEMLQLQLKAKRQTNEQ